MADYSRPASGFRLIGGRLKTNSSADAMPEDCYPYLQNTRFYNESSVTSRPPIVQSQPAPSGNTGTVLSLEPTIGIYKIGTKIFNQGTAIDTGYASGLGASLCPFRPNASPNAYEYVFDQAKASKVFIPSSGPAVVNKVGIAEPQNSPEACIDHFNVFPFNGAAATWANTGTAGALTDVNRVTDTAVAFFLDPAAVSPILAPRYSMQVGTTVSYSVGELLSVVNSSGGSAAMIVQDVLPPANQQTTLSILSIFYFTGNTGRCVIVPSQMPVNNTAPQFEGNNPVGDSINTQQLISALRRGSLISIGTGGTKETVFVLSATLGPQNSVCFECITVNPHAAGESMTGVPAVSVSFTEAPSLLTGQAISESAINSSIAVGTGLITKTISGANNPFINQGFLSDPTLATPQQDDYVHISLNIADVTLVTNIRIAFDVNNGAADFTSNFFYHDVRPNDLTSAVAGTQSQLGAAQVALQRNIIDLSIGNPDIIPSINPLGVNRLPVSPVAGTTDINTSDQTTLGTSQWSEVMFPISTLTRVGNDMTRTLANCQSVQLQLTVTNTDVIKFGAFWVESGGQPDVGDAGILYFYRVRGRNSVTGTKGNPSPATRYGVSPRRQNVIVPLPSPSYDSQIDTWDVFRFGGSITEWRYVGSVPSTSTTFTDTIFDLAITNNELLSFDNLEPFPSIGPPVRTSTASITGTAMQVTFPTAASNPAGFGTLSQLGNLLPGNVITVGAQKYTLEKRPTLVSTTPGTQTYLFRLVENANNLTNPLVIIQEPNLAAQPTNRVWGPDAQGVFFSVMAGATNNNGIGLRPGLIQWTNPNDPDAAAASNTKELCPPTEPFVNGAIVSGYPVVFSASRAWSGIPQSDGSYAWRGIPVSAGLAAEFGICSDGNLVYYVAKDGIRASQIGNSQSLTDLDLYNIFPHEGIFPANYSYAGQTVFAPEYRFASNVRLACVNGFLYFDYLDSSQNQRTLTCDLRKTAWCVDVYSGTVSIHAGTTNPASNQKIPASATRNQQLYLGDTTGAIYNEQSTLTQNAGEVISCLAVTREEMVGDIRANKLFGDAAIDCLAAGSNMTVTPIFYGTAFVTSTVIAGGQSSRPSSPPTINLLGEQIKRSMGLSIAWTDQGTSSSVFMWQISYVTQPEDISNRITDWDNAGTQVNKFFQGFQIECDTLNAIKSLMVRDGDALALHSFVSDNSALSAGQVKANGQQVITCSFPTPFRAHLARIEPQDLNTWRLFRVTFIAEPTPEFALNWITQPTSHGLPGYQHLKQMLVPYSATAPVTMSVTVDGVTSAFTLPATSGFVKTLLPFSALLKGLVFQYSATSTQPFGIWNDDLEVFLKAWGDSGPYRNIKLLGDSMGPRATI
jgi:hypothetical protein